VGYIMKGKKGYFLETIPIPRAIYRRNWYRKTFEPLASSLLNDGKIIYNERIFNFGKYEEYLLISKSIELSPYLPTTHLATQQNVKRMMSRFNSLIIKPNHSELGKGIMKLEKTGNRWCLLYKIKIKNNGWVWRRKYFKYTLPAILIKRLNNKKYIVQERINLTTFQGAPFDMRVAVQKNHLGKWEVTAIIAKVAGEDQFLTNVHQGGRTYTLDHLLKDHPSLSLEQVKKNIHEFCLKTAEHINSHYPHLGDLGFDIAITNEGFIYYIEVNRVSAYASLVLRNNKLINKEWENVFYKPIEYGLYLLQRQ
jgi:glutathione synthase/RimK-type ligase-like ATP-grasp enzyme